MFHTSQSKTETWRRCRQAYHFSYVENLAPRRINRPFAFGRIIHEMKELKAQGDDPFLILSDLQKKHGRMFKEEIEEYGDILGDTRLIMVDYYDYDKERGSIEVIPRRKQHAEHPFEIEIDKGILFKGKIDQFARSKNKLNWIVEHKNHKDIPDEDRRWRNLQSAVYTRAVDMLGWLPVEGLLWDYIRSKSPSRPSILKNGQFSKRAMDTLPSVVVDQIVNVMGRKPSDIPKFMIDAAKRNRPNYFQRIYTPTKKALIDKVFADFLETSREMADLHGKSKTKTIGQHCAWCQFEPLCRAELRGLDVDYIKEHDYYVDKADYKNSWQAPPHKARPAGGRRASGSGRV